MPAFGRRSQTRLSTCHPDLQRLFRVVVVHFDCTVLCGRRGRTAQEIAFHDGASEVNWPDSKHNVADVHGREITDGLSEAVDVAPWFVKRPHIRWEDERMWDHFNGFVLGVAVMLSIEIRSGHDWDGDHDLRDQKFIDSPHWELVKTRSPGEIIEREEMLDRAWEKSGGVAGARPGRFL